PGSHSDDPRRPKPLRSWEPPTSFLTSDSARGMPVPGGGRIPPEAGILPGCRGESPGEKNGPPIARRPVLNADRYYFESFLIASSISLRTDFGVPLLRLLSDAPSSADGSTIRIVGASVTFHFLHSSESFLNSTFENTALS